MFLLVFVDISEEIPEEYGQKDIGVAISRKEMVRISGGEIKGQML